MADMEKKLTFRLLGDTSGLDRSLKNSQKESKGLGDVMGKLGGVIAATFTIGAIVGFTKQIAEVGLNFESQMAKVQAISGATGSELQALEDEARRLGATTMFSATQAGEGLEYFAMAGWSVEDSISALEPTLRLAQASGEDLGAVADIVSDSMTAFGMSADEAGQFTDLLASTATSSNTNVGMMGESFKYVAPLMGTMGATAEDTALALGLMANAGIKSGMAGTSLKTAMSNLISPTKQMQQAMDSAGVSAQYNADGSLNLKGTLDGLRSSFSTLTKEQQAQTAEQIFGKEAMSGMLSIVNASEEDYNKLSLATSDYNGTAKEMADIMENTLKGRIANMKSAWEELLLVLFDKLLPVFETVVEWLTNLIKWVANLEATIKEKMGQSEGTLGKFKEFFVGVGTKVGEIIAIMVQTFKDWYERNKEVIDGIVEKFKMFLAIVGDIINGVLDIIKVFIDLFMLYFLDYGIGIINGFSTVFLGIATIIKGVVDVIAGILSGDWSRAWNGAKGILEGVWISMVGVIEQAVAKIKALVNVMLGLFNKIISGWNGIQFKVPKISLPFGMGSFGGNTISVPQVPKIPLLADGGIVTAPTLAMIGEGGESEAVIPLSKLGSFGDSPTIVQVILDGRVIQESMDRGFGRTVYSRG